MGSGTDPSNASSGSTKDPRIEITGGDTLAIKLKREDNMDNSSQNYLPEWPWEDMYDEPSEWSYLVECPTYLFIASSGAIKRLPRRCPLLSIMDPDRLLGSCPLRFPPLISFLVEPLVLLGYCLPWTRLLVISATFITVDTWKDWCGWNR